MIHPSAIVDASARIADGVTVGPYSIIGADVEIDEGTTIASHVVINGPTRIGRDNRIHQFNSIGDVPQDKKFRGERSALEIGNGNVIREYCTFNRGTELGGGVTRIGDGNWIMAYVHVAHDCLVGNHTIMANATTLAGHVRVEDYAVFGAFTVVHQFCAVGAHSISAMGTVVLKDVPPFVMVAGNSANAYGLNIEGLKRRGFDADTIRELRRAYKAVYRNGLTVEHALQELDEIAADSEHVKSMADFIRRSSRGIVR
ncbi:MAG: acyl-ACP--UDP-N-acetylglucosamine O-acyltransferase [Gammaproteobacteria bacterium]|nr:acyl-ACP--UDP-N-acetylglucosamine O-acyltransferase [Gammaproteobacteria bacterium]